jgi:Tol biopolymer transport system component
VSPDGRRLLFVSGLDYTTHPTTYLPSGEESLEVLNLETGERRLLDGPLAGTSYHRLRWSPDGRRLGYLVGHWRHQQGFVGPSDFDLYITNLPSGETKLAYRAEGVRPYPSFTWSPSGSWLLVEVERGGPSEEEIIKAREGLRFELVQERLLVNVETGEARPWEVEGESVVRFGWAPDEDSLVYRIGQTLYSQSVDGDVRELATIFGDECPFCDSYGWSPDGRYIGLSDWWQTIAVLDTMTGEVRILFQEEGENAFIFPHGWWR